MPSQLHRRGELSDAGGSVEDESGRQPILIERPGKRLQGPSVSEKTGESSLLIHATFMAGKAFFRTARTRSCT